MNEDYFADGQEGAGRSQLHLPEILVTLLHRAVLPPAGLLPPAGSQPPRPPARERVHPGISRALTMGLDDLNSTLPTLEKGSIMKMIAPVRLGEVSAYHFLASEQVECIIRSIGKGECPAEAAVKLESFEALHLLLGPIQWLSAKEHISEGLGSASGWQEPGGYHSVTSATRITRTYAYLGNLLNRLDPMICYLGAIEVVALVLGREKREMEAAERRKMVQGN